MNQNQRNPNEIRAFNLYSLDNLNCTSRCLFDSENTKIICCLYRL